MNGAGVYLIIIALSLFTAKWGYTWLAGRRLMRKTRQQNKRISISSLISRWKKEDIAWGKRVSEQEDRENHTLDSTAYMVQARQRAIEESTRQTEAYYKSLTSEENIGVTLVGSGPLREVSVEEGRRPGTFEAKAADYRPTLTQSEQKIAAGVKKANKRYHLEKAGFDTAKVIEVKGVGLDLERIGKEFGLTTAEMLEAYKKAESMVNKNYN